MKRDLRVLAAAGALLLLSSATASSAEGDPGRAD